MISRRLIVQELRAIAKRIEDGTCGVDDEELIEIGAMLMSRKLNIEMVCQKYNISRATLNRWQQKGKLPPFRKDSGGKDYLLQTEIEESLRIWNQNHPED